MRLKNKIPVVMLLLISLVGCNNNQVLSSSISSPINSNSTSSSSPNSTPTSTPVISTPVPSTPTPSTPVPSTLTPSTPSTTPTPSTPIIFSSSIHVHHYGELIVDKAADEFYKGEGHRICSCGNIKYEVIDYTLDFPRVHINYWETHPKAPDASNHNAWANWLWHYLDVPIRYEGIKSDNGSRDFDCYALMRIQGGYSKSSDCLKKNYTIKLYNEKECETKNKVVMVDEWGAESKYVLKANWTDVTSARNIVGARLWSDVVESRKTSEVVSKRDYVEKMIHNGCVDGYPVMLYFNDTYYGLYTFNIPRDNWMYGMKKDPNQALLYADNRETRSDGSKFQSTSFKELIDWNSSSLSGCGWQLEYGYDETNTQWIADSMNEGIQLVMDTYGSLYHSLSIDRKREIRDKFKKEAPKHFDIDGIIDYIIFLHCIQGFADNSNKNIIWSTYDGKIWSPNAYDLDTTFGLAWHGIMYFYEGSTINETSGGFWASGDSWYRPNLRGNALLEAVSLFYAEESQLRYQELRKGPLSYENISERFTTFISGIPTVLMERDIVEFPTRPSEQLSPLTGLKNDTDLNQIITYAEKLLNFFDTQYVGESSPVSKNISYFD